MSESPDELLTTPQVGALLGVSSRTVHRAAVDGVLPIAKKLPGPNGAFLFRRTDAMELKRRRAPAKSA